MTTLMLLWHLYATPCMTQRWDPWSDCPAPQIDLAAMGTPRPTAASSQPCKLIEDAAFQRGYQAGSRHVLQEWARALYGCKDGECNCWWDHGLMCPGRMKP